MILPIHKNKGIVTDADNYRGITLLGCFCKLFTSVLNNRLTEYIILQPTRGENVLYIVLSSQKELVDNVKIFEPLGNSDHNKIHFDINVKSESKNKKTYKRNFHKGNYKDMRKYLAKLDWNNMLMNKTAIECWNILKYEIESHR